MELTSAIKEESLDLSATEAKETLISAPFELDRTLT